MILKYSQQTQDMAKPKQFWFEHQHNNEIFFFLAYFIVQFKQEKQQWMYDMTCLHSQADVDPMAQDDWTFGSAAIHIMFPIMRT